MTKVAKILKGDKFICLLPRLVNPTAGVVIALTTDPGKMIGLELEHNVGIHSCDGRGKDGYCVWARPEHLLTEQEYAEDLKAKEAAKAAAAIDLEELILRK